MDRSMGRATSDLRSRHLSLMADDSVDCVGVVCRALNAWRDSKMIERTYLSPNLALKRALITIYVTRLS